jgi:hypothetical protein
MVLRAFGLSTKLTSMAIGLNTIIAIKTKQKSIKAVIIYTPI